MVTIKDIARESGYSISTVSRVLNHRNDVSPDAKKKIEEVVEKFQNEGDKIDGLAFSMPGVIDVKRGHMITGGALYDLYDFPFKSELEKYIGIPVELENDVNCVALAEKWLGNAKECENL